MLSKTGARTIRVLIVDDHPTVREGLTGRIDAQPDMAVCGEAATVEEALAQAAALQPDVVIVDISLKRGGDGLDLIRQLASRGRLPRMLVHSMHDEALYADRCLRAGASGYIKKEEDPVEVIRAVRAVDAGKVYVSPELQEQMLARSVGRTPAQGDPISMLTNRELEVFRAIGEGLTTAQIACRLGRSVHTIETHRENLKRKLDVKSIAELTRRAVQWTLEHS